MTAVSLKQPREVFAGDLDGDNDADLIVTDAVAAPVRLRNDGGNASHAIRLALTGLNDNRSGIGTKVEVQAGAIWQKFETTAASSLLGSHAGEILAGVGPGDPGRCRPSALADRRRPGRSAARGERAAQDPADRSPRQLVPDSLLVERQPVRVHLRHDRPGGHRPLGGAWRVRHARHRRVREGRRQQGPRQGRPCCRFTSRSRWRKSTTSIR